MHLFPMQGAASTSRMPETGLLGSALPSSCLGFPTALSVTLRVANSGGRAGAAGRSRALLATAGSVGGGGSDGRRAGNHFRRPGCGFLRSPLLGAGGEKPLARPRPLSRAALLAVGRRHSSAGVTSGQGKTW